MNGEAFNQFKTVKITVIQVFAVVVTLLCAASLHANQVMVQELRVSPNQLVTITVSGTSPAIDNALVYAGVNKLLVDGTAMDGFCIDPFHYSSASPLLYNVVDLTQAPKAPGTMNSVQAATVSKLWAMNYSTNMTAQNAAGLQIAIWEVVGKSSFTLVGGSDYGANSLLASVLTYTGAGADLVGLTGAGQDYVVRRTGALRTPDQGTTLLLLGLASATLLGTHAVRLKIGTRSARV